MSEEDLPEQRSTSRAGDWKSVGDLLELGYHGIVRGYINSGPVVRPSNTESPAERLRLAVSFFRSHMHRVIEHSIFRGRTDLIAKDYPEISETFKEFLGGNAKSSSCYGKVGEFLAANLVRSEDGDDLRISPAAVQIMAREGKIIRPISSKFQHDSEHDIINKLKVKIKSRRSMEPNSRDIKSKSERTVD